MDNLETNQNEVPEFAHELYSEYLKSCAAVNLQPLSFDEFYHDIYEEIGTRQNDKSSTEQEVNENITELGYLWGGGSNQGRVKVEPKANKVPKSTTGKTLGDAVEVENVQGSTGQVIEDPGAQALKAIFAMAADKLITMGAEKGLKWLENKFNNNGGEEGSFQEEVSHYGTSTDSRALSYEPDPIEIRLNSGIKTYGYSRLLQDSSTTYQNAHLTMGYFSFPTSTLNTTYLYNYISSAAYTRLLDAVQAQVNFTIPAVFTVDKMITYYNSVALALQRYYFIASVLSYCSNPLNKHTAMYNLRGSLSTTDINAFYTLGENLRNIPIPKALNDFCFYLMQNYTASELPGSELLLICPFAWNTFPSTTSSTSISYSTNLAQSIAAINTSDNVQIASVLGRVAPQWLLTKLKDSPSMPLHDPNYCTIWSNLPAIVWQDTNNVNYITSSVTDATTNITYYTKSNELDGLAFALAGICTSTTDVSKQDPGLFTVMTAVITKSGYSPLTNRLSYTTYSSTTGWYPSAVSTSPAISRPDTVNVNTAGSYSFRPSGYEILDGVNITSVTQSAYQVVDYLFGGVELLGNTLSELSSKGIKRGSRGSRSNRFGKGKFHKGKK